MTDNSHLLQQVLPMPEDPPDPVMARYRLADLLTAARLAAGQPKLATLGRQVGYHESMMSRVMKARVIPTRDKLELIAEQLDVSNSVYQAVWLPLWEAAKRKPELAVRTAPVVTPASEDLARPTGAPIGFSCPACGAWVVDGKRHMEWHMHAEGWPRQSSVTALRSVQ